MRARKCRFSFFPVAKTNAWVPRGWDPPCEVYEDPSHLVSFATLNQWARGTLYVGCGSFDGMVEILLQKIRNFFIECVILEK